MKTVNPAQAEKMKCIKNTKTGKVQRLAKSVCEQIIADDSNWHFTTKSAYEKAIVDAIPAGPSTHPNSYNKTKKASTKYQRKDNTEVQVIKSTTKLDSSEIKKPAVVFNKPRVKVPYKSKINEVEFAANDFPPVADTSTNLMVKVPDILAEPKVVSVIEPKTFITTIKRIYHLIVDGKQVKPLVK